MTVKYALTFMDDLKARLANRVQLTSDGHKAYLEAVEAAFGADVDYAQLVKIYGEAPDSTKGRYSPAECIGASDTDRRQARPEAISTRRIPSARTLRCGCTCAASRG